MTYLTLIFNDIGGSEIVLIMLVVLMFFGSKSIPGIAKTLGRTLYEFRNATSELQNEIKKSGFDIKNDLKIENILKDTTEPIVQPMDQVYSDIENTVHYDSTAQNLTKKTDDTVIGNSEILVEQITESAENLTSQESVIPNQTAAVEEPIKTKTSE